MVTKLPGAKWKPISRNYTNRKRASTTKVLLHASASGSATSLYSYFNRSGVQASSHLFIAKDGTVEQYVDLDKIAWTSVEGNSTTIGIETQCTGYEPWTKAQRAAIVKTLAWICDHYKIPARIITSSASSQHGIGSHRYGCDGNFPSLPSIQAGRIQRGGGEHWSGYPGKVCPGDPAQAQMPGIASDVAKLLNPPKTQTPTIKEDAMIPRTTTTSQTQTPAKGAWKGLRIDDKNNVSLLISNRQFVATVNLTVEGLPVGGVVQAKFVRYDDAKKANAYSYPFVEIFGSAGKSAGQFTCIGELPKGQRLRVMFNGPDGAKITHVRTDVLYSA